MTNMIRTFWFGIMDGMDPANQPDADKWYIKTHAREFRRWFGAWLRRYQTYKAYVPKGGLSGLPTRFGLKAGWHTEMWWTSEVEFVEANPIRYFDLYTPFNGPQPMDPVFTTTMAVPDKDFLDIEPKPADPIFRWIRVFKYETGVSIADSENWYLNVFGPSTAKNTTGLIKYVTYKALAPSVNPFGWNRVDELWFSNFKGWQAAFINPLPLYPKQPSRGPGIAEIVSTFVAGAYPTYDFLRDCTIP